MFRMNFKAEKTDKTNEMKLEFTIDAKVFEDGIQEVFKKSAKYFNIPGFRKGKVHIGHGSIVTYKVTPSSLQLFSFLQAFCMTNISA